MKDDKCFYMVNGKDKRAEGIYYYKIPINIDFDYETATEKEFLEFIQSIL